jgi:hypothetical protein
MHRNHGLTVVVGKGVRGGGGGGVRRAAVACGSSLLPKEYSYA